MPDPVKIDIVTTADTTGAQRTADALGAVNAQTKRAGEEAAKTSKSVNDLGENFEKGAAAGRVIGEVSRGNVLALGGLGAAIKAVGALLRANLIGGLITLGAIAFNVLAPLLKGFLEAKKSAEDAGKGIEAARKEAAALADQRLDTLKGELAAAADEAKRLLDNMTATVREAQKVDDAQRAVELARIQDDTSLTPAERARRTAEVNLRYDARRQSRALDPYELAVRTATEERDAMQLREDGAAGRFAEARDRADNYTRLRTDAEATIAASRQQLAREGRELAARNLPSMEAQAVRAAQLTAAREREQPAFDRLALLNNEAGRAKAARLAEEQAGRAEELAAANEAAVAAAERLTKAEADLARERDTQAKIQPLNAEIRQRELNRGVAAAGAEQLAGVAVTTAPAAAALAAAGLANPVTAQNPQTRAALAALQKAAQAAQDGGTTVAEAAAFAEALNLVVAALKTTQLRSVALEKVVTDLKAQVKGLIQ